MKGKIRDILIELGFQTSMSGYRCLLIAVPMYHDNPGQSVTKELYPEVGHRMAPKCTGQQVEKQIRYAISKAWERGKADIWEQFFPDGKPTNLEFISMLSELWDRWTEQ